MLVLAHKVVTVKAFSVLLMRVKIMDSFNSSQYSLRAITEIMIKIVLNQNIVLIIKINKNKFKKKYKNK